MSTATLIDGSTVCSASEAWRHECEARHIAHLPTREQRQEYVARVTAKRGPAAGQALQTLAATIFKTERHAAR